jgi:hypothetical protein
MKQPRQSFGECYGGSSRKERERLKELIDENFGLLELATNSGGDVKKGMWTLFIRGIFHRCAIRVVL